MSNADSFSFSGGDAELGKSTTMTGPFSVECRVRFQQSRNSSIIVLNCHKAACPLVN